MSLDPIRRLETMGHDVAKTPISRIPSLRKVVFMVLNCYKSYRGNLGTAPINDAVAFGKLMKNFDFEIYILQTPHVRNFLPILDRFLQNTTEQLVFYYTGQPLVDLDETEGTEYHFQFDDGTVSQADVAQHIANNKNPDSQCIIMTTRAPNGCIFAFNEEGTVEGVQLPPKCMSICAVRDEKYARTQTMTMANDEGIFMFTFCNTMKEVRDCTPFKLQDKMKKTMKDYGHVIHIGLTSPEEGDQVLFYQDMD